MTARRIDEAHRPPPRGDRRPLAAVRPRRRQVAPGWFAPRRAAGWLLLLLLLPLPASAIDTTAGLELTAPVRQNLHRIQAAWQRWTSAYYRDDRNMAETAVEEMLSITEYLGMSRLPDLSMAAAAYAVVAAREGSAERAEWVLTAAEQLDPGRPETEFARAAVLRQQGDFLGAVGGWGRALVKLARLEPERRFLLHNLIGWLFYVVLLSGGLFVALQMVSRGEEVVADLQQLLPSSFDGGLGLLVIAVLLLWPLLLPSGILWLVAYWSILLWSHGSFSERLVLIGLWVFLGLVPALMGFQHRFVQIDLAPPSRAIAALSSGRLYGSLFSDISVLRQSLPEDTGVLELIADLHRRFEQWDYARPLYNELVEHPDQNVRDTATALVNLGVFHHRNGDYATAITYFQAAGEADPKLAAAFFNLSQAFSQSYDFANSHRALATAKEVDNAAVEVWLNSSGQEDAASSVVPVDGGLERTVEICRQLMQSWRGGKQEPSLLLWRRHLSLLAAAAVLFLALIWDRLRGRRGFTVRSAGGDRVDLSAGWLQALIPGLASAQHGHGFRALLGLMLPVAVILVPVMMVRGYQVPLGFDDGLVGLLTVVSAVVLFLVLLARLRVAMGAER